MSHFFLQFNLFVIFITLVALILGNGESSDGYLREINYHDNKLRKNSIIKISNNKRMFSTSATFFNPGRSAKAELLKKEYNDLKAERARIGEEYDKLNEIDSLAQDASESDTDEQRIANKNLREKTDEFKAVDYQVRMAKHAYNKETKENPSDTE
jgi:hypothetical protein